MRIFILRHWTGQGTRCSPLPLGQRATSLSVKKNWDFFILYILKSLKVQMMSFENHIAIITGSAQGFGKEFAVRLLQKGGKVCISDVNVELGLQTLKELQETYGQNRVAFHK